MFFDTATTESLTPLMDMDCRARLVTAEDFVLPSREMDRFQNKKSWTEKGKALEWGKKTSTAILQEILSTMEAPLKEAEMAQRPVRRTKEGKCQWASSKVSAGNVSIEVTIVEWEGIVDAWVTLRLDPPMRWSQGYIGKNLERFKQFVSLFDDDMNRIHDRTKSKGEFVKLAQARWLEFEVRLGEKDDNGDRRVTAQSLHEWSRLFSPWVTGIMSDSLEMRRGRYYNLRKLIPIEEMADNTSVGGDDRILEQRKTVEALLAAINSRPLILLSGVSGSGKTQLARRIGRARAMGTLWVEDGEGSLVERQMQALQDDGIVILEKRDEDWVWVLMPSGVVSEDPDVDSGQESQEATDDQEEDELMAEEEPEEDSEEEAGDETDEDGDEDTDGAAEVTSGRFALVPVQSDWKEASSLWGWYHPLDGGSFYGTEALKVFLNAWEKVEDGHLAPHTLLLDEMNLSRIEHYGSDLLSAMEVPDKPVIQLHRRGGPVPLAGEVGTDVPSNIGWRKGLVVIGTVNVDETTFSFAPKVLDRAAVLEFLEVSLENYFLWTDQEKLWKSLGEWFNAVQEVTRPHVLHLGYRAAREIVACLKVHLGDDPESWTGQALAPLLDFQLRNKILARVRGSRGSVEPVLIGLLSLAVAGPDGWREKRQELQELSDQGWPPDLVKEKLGTTDSGSAAEKALQMLQRAVDVGFTGFFQ